MWLRIQSALRNFFAGNVEAVVSPPRDALEPVPTAQTLEEAIFEHRNVLDTIPDVIYSLDLNGSFTKWNRRFTDLVGESQDIGRKSVLDFFSAEDRPRIAQALLDVFDRGYAELESSLISADGTPIPFQWAIAPMKNIRGAVVGVIAAGRDVSEHRLAEQTLVRRESLFRSLIENMSEVISIVEADGTITFNTPAVESVLGYKADATIGRSVFEFVHPDDREVLTNALTGAAASTHMFGPAEFRLRDRLGGWHLVETVGRAFRSDDGVTRVIATTRDVTQRQRAQEELRASEEKYRLLFEQSTDAIYITQDGKIVDINPAGARLFGFSREEMIGMPNERLFAEQKDRIRFLADLLRTESVTDFEAQLIRKDESVFDCLITASLRSAGGESIGTHAIVRDITERKQAEEAQRQMTAMLEEVAQEWMQTFDAVESPILLLSEDTRISRVNRAARDLSGKASRDLLRMRIGELPGQPWQKIAELAAEVRRTTSSASAEVADDRGRVWDIAATAALLAPNDLRVLTIARDVTARKKAEAALEHRAAFETVIANISSTFIELSPGEVDTGITLGIRAVGEFTGVDRAHVSLFDETARIAETTHEWTAAGISTRRAAMPVMHADSFRWSMERLRRNEPVHVPAIEDLPPPAIAERRFLMENQIRSTLLLPIVTGQTLLGILGFDSLRHQKAWNAEDVNLLRSVAELFANAIERRRADLALRGSEERFRSLSSSAPVGIFQTDLSGTTTYTNERWQSISGFSAEEAVVLGWMAAIHPEDVSRVREEWSEAMKAGSEFAIECRVLTTSREVKWVRLRSQAMAAVGEISGYVGTVEDITAIRNAEEAQAKLQDKLRQNETMLAMGSLVAGIAHEVRNPLFSISATLDAFEARFGQQTDYHRYIRLLRGEVERLTNLMKELLDYGRPHPLSLAPGSLQEVMAESLRAVQPLAEAAAVRMEWHIGEEPPPVLRDRDRLIQVFNNLLENAVQHTPRDGVITISMSEQRADNMQWVECVVRDTGRGFSSDEMQKIFEPFYTRRRGGTGLGLSIVKRIVEGHGGRIHASNHPQGGAIMRVSFPAAGVAQPVH